MSLNDFILDLVFMGTKKSVQLLSFFLVEKQQEKTKDRGRKEKNSRQQQQQRHIPFHMSDAYRLHILGLVDSFSCSKEKEEDRKNTLKICVSPIKKAHTHTQLYLISKYK